MIASALLDVLRLSLWLLALAIIFVPMERLFALHPTTIWRKDIAVDIGLYFLNSLLPALVLSVPLAAAAWAAHAIMPHPIQQAIAEAPFVLRLVAAFVVGEIGFYWGHRWTHEVPLLWHFHRVHHEAEHLDWLVNTRGHPVDVVFTRLVGLVPIYALGLGSPASGSDTIIPALVVIVGTVWGFFIHANVAWRLGPLEQVVSTPAFHHWHHVRTGPINTNYASMLPWLDRVFGTHHLPRAWPPAYGVEPAAPGGEATREPQVTTGSGTARAASLQVDLQPR